MKEIKEPSSILEIKNFVLVNHIALGDHDVCGAQCSHQSSILQKEWLPCLQNEEI